VYSEEYSVIGNIFDARLEKTGAQLLRVYILGGLVKLGAERNFDYKAGVAIREANRTIGFADEHVLRVLGDLCEMRFMHTASHGAAEFAANFFPTRLGGYVLRVFIGQFAFVENMLMDTFVADREKWEQLWDLSQSIKEERDIATRVKLRVERVQSFYDYMIELYKPVVEEARRRGLSAEWCSSPLEEMRDQLFSDCARAIKSAQRAYGG
jgi:hypothetical protein